MALAIAIVVVALLLFAFFALTSFEAKSGKRFMRASREKLDTKTEHMLAVAREVDLGKLIFHAAHAAWDHLVHDVVHFFLFVVRVLERTLTRVAREIRGRRADGTSARVPLSESMERIKSVLRKEKGDKVE